MTPSSLAPRLKAVARDALPQPAVEALREVRDVPRLIEARTARKAWASAPTTPSHLGYAELEQLQAEYPRAEHGYRYDPASLEARGEARAVELLRLPGTAAAQDVLELGAWDGMVSAALQRRGKSTTAADRRDIGFDQRAKDAGVRTLKMDAAALDFPDDSFDLVFSYDAFEHFEDPAAVLAEITRVVRPGGHVFLWFGPLYLSPMGEHAYRTISVPYCQVLFTEATIDEYTRNHGLGDIDFSHCNRWRIEQFRELWKQTEALEVLSYRESTDYRALDLVRRYPSCFRDSSDSFEDFVVSHVSVLFRRRP